MERSIGSSEGAHPDPEVILNEIIKSHVGMRSLGSSPLNTVLVGDRVRIDHSTVYPAETRNLG